MNSQAIASTADQKIQAHANGNGKIYDPRMVTFFKKGFFQTYFILSDADAKKPSIRNEKIKKELEDEYIAFNRKFPLRGVDKLNLQFIHIYKEAFVGITAYLYNPAVKGDPIKSKPEMAHEKYDEIAIEFFRDKLLVKKFGYTENDLASLEDARKKMNEVVEKQIMDFKDEFEIPTEQEARTTFLEEGQKGVQAAVEEIAVFLNALPGHPNKILEQRGELKKTA